MRKSQSNRNLLLNLSLWILVSACILLLLLLALFAASNYRREKELIVEALTQKGTTLMRFINSSVRESIRDHLRSGEEWSRWQDHMQAAMAQAVEQPGVEFVLLIDGKGNILSAAGMDKPLTATDAAAKAFLATLRAQNSPPAATRIFRDDKGEQKFQIAARYWTPAMGDAQRGGPERGRWRGQMMQRFRRAPQFDMIRGAMGKLMDLHPVYLIELDIDQFNSPLRRQLLQIVILFMVIVLVGIGGVLSFYTLKGLKGSQSRLKKMRVFTDILVSSLPIGLIATDSVGAVRICNGAACELIGVREGQVLGLMPRRCLPVELAGLFSGKDLGESSTRQGEVELTVAQGRVKTLQLVSVIVLDESEKFAGEVLLLRDLTTVKHLEKELRRSERLAALGKMAAGIAHELRNPLSSIKGLALILRSTFSDPSKEAETSDILVKEVERLNRSIGELLDYAKPGRLNKEPASLREIIDKTVSLVKVDADSFNISIRLDHCDDIPVLPVDKDKMAQVFLNLFLNSIQAMDQGGELVVRTEIIDQAIVITIRDNGVGMDAESLVRAFDPYFTTKSEGTGLGLSMSSKIVEEHGGKITLRSVENEFTEARIALPLT